MKSLVFGGLSVFLFFVATAGCARLPDVEPGVCGNGIVEPLAGEDCEAPTAQCRAPGEVGQCRIDCDPAAPSETSACPDGWNCSSAGLCVRPSSSFASPFSVSSEFSGYVQAGDLDGNGAAELIWQAQTTTEARSFGADGSIRSVTSLLRSDPLHLPPTVGDLTDDGIDDLVFGGMALEVFEGQTSGALQPVAYPSISVAIDDAQPLMLSDGPLQGDQLFAVTTGGVALPVGKWEQDHPLNTSTSFSAVIGDFREGDLSPCEELVVAPVGDGGLTVYSRCSEGDQLDWELDAVALPRVRLSEGARVASRLHRGDLNLDGHQDLVVETRSEECSACSGLQAAYGLGDGTFHSNQNLPSDGVGNNRAGVLSVDWLKVTPPLVIGDLNGDGVVDLVTPLQILLSQPGSQEADILEEDSYAPLFSKPIGAWTDAVLGDFDGREGLDIALQDGTDRLTIVSNSQEGLLSESFLSVGSPPENLTVGDFDGDSVDDLAFSRSDVALGVDEVVVVWGASEGGLNHQTVVAEFSQVDHLGVGQLADEARFKPQPDAIDDLVVAARDERGQAGFAVMIGSAGRILSAPFSFRGLEFELNTVLGRFGNRNHLDLASMALRAYESDRGMTARLRLAPSRGAAQIELGTWVFAGLDWGPHVPPSSLMVPVDLDGDGRDELVMLGYRGDFESGVLVVARAEKDAEGQYSWKFVQEHSTEEFYTRSIHDQGNHPLVDEPVENYFGHAVAADVNADGLPDVVALGAVGFDGWRAESTELVVYLNDGSGGLDAGKRLRMKTAGNPTAFTLIQADIDPMPELVYATETSATVTEIDLPAKVLVPLAPLAVAGAVSIQGGDYDGNGIDDIAFAGNSGVTVVFGQGVQR